MNKSGITEQLLSLASVLTGRLQGGLAQVSIALSALMGGVSGSCIADAAMQTRMIGDEMLKRGSSKGYTDLKSSTATRSGWAAKGGGIRSSGRDSKQAKLPI